MKTQEFFNNLDVMTTKEYITNQLDHMDNDQLLDLNNQLDDNSIIYYNDDSCIDYLFTNPSDALKAAYFGDYNPNETFFTINDCGNLESSNFLVDDLMFTSDLADIIIDEDSHELLNDYEDYLEDQSDNIIQNLKDDNNINKVNEIIKQINQIEDLKTTDYHMSEFIQNLQSDLDTLVKELDDSHLLNK